LKGEHLDHRVLDVIEGAVTSAVKYAEVWTKVNDLGLTSAPRTRDAFSLLDRVEPFTESQARLAATLRRATQHAGLSLGDRAYLALALEVGGEVYAADRQWSNVSVGCTIHLIR
jgi:ribonuclease VapC